MSRPGRTRVLAERVDHSALRPTLEIADESDGEDESPLAILDHSKGLTIRRLATAAQDFAVQDTDRALQISSGPTSPSLLS